MRLRWSFPTPSVVNHRLHRAFDMQSHSFPLCQVVIAYAVLSVVASSKTRFRNPEKSSAPRVSLASEEHSARLMSAFHRVSA